MDHVDCDPPNVKYVMRSLTRKTSTFTVEDCAPSRDDWEFAKPKMSFKLYNSNFVPGDETTFTSDGWHSFHYVCTECAHGCILFKHKKDIVPSLLFRKVGGPELTLDVYHTSDYTMEASISLMSGQVIFKREVLGNDKLQHVTHAASVSSEMSQYMNVYDWHDKSIFSNFGEIVPPGLTMFEIWKAGYIHQHKSMEHIFCGCQRSLAHGSFTVK